MDATATAQTSILELTARHLACRGDILCREASVQSGAFYGDPHLVVLDEPNASLDALGERMLLDAIEGMKAANSRAVIITHRNGILAATDKIAIMQGGTINAFGDSEDTRDIWLDRNAVRASRCSINGSRNA